MLTHRALKMLFRMISFSALKMTMRINDLYNYILSTIIQLNSKYTVLK